MAAPKCPDFCYTEIVLAVAKLRENFARDGKAVEKPVVPCATPDVVEHGAGGVARLDCMHLAAGQPEQEKAIDRAEAHLAFSRPLWKTRHIGEQPNELGRREIRIDDEPGRLFDMHAPALASQLVAMLRRAPVLPHDGIGERLARGALPHDRRLALIGDADRGDPPCADVLERRASHCEHRLPDLLRVVLHLARSGIDLGERDLRGCARPSLIVEDNGAGARRPLIDGEHKSPPAHERDPVWPTIQPQYSSLPPSVGSTSSAGSS